MSNLRNCSACGSGICLQAAEGAEECRFSGPLLSDWTDDDPFGDLEERECPACYGTGIEGGDLADPHEPPCESCGGWGTV